MKMTKLCSQRPARQGNGKVMVGSTCPQQIHACQRLKQMTVSYCAVKAYFNAFPYGWREPIPTRKPNWIMFDASRVVLMVLRQSFQG